jgi:hypothetical protein
MVAAYYSETSGFTEGAAKYRNLGDANTDYEYTYIYVLFPPRRNSGKWT